MLGWLECRSMARTRRSGVNRSCVLIAPISSTGAPGELGTRPRARSRRSTQRLVEWSDVFSAEASCCAAVPVGGCERGRGERAHAPGTRHAANLLKLFAIAVPRPRCQPLGRWRCGGFARTFRGAAGTTRKTHDGHGLRIKTLRRRGKWNQCVRLEAAASSGIL